MAISTLDGIVGALANNSSRLVINKSSINNVVAGQHHSLWRATGQPGQGAIPTTAEVCNNTFVGAFQFTQQTSPTTSYGGWATVACGNSAVSVEIHDRLMHMGGLNATLTTAQTVGIDLNGITASNMVERIGDANYSDIQWFLEWYTDTGGTASNATIAVTYHDGTTGNLTAVAVGGTLRESRLIPLNGLIPASAAGKYIRGIVSVTLSASTSAAGNFGVTATRLRMSMPTNVSNKAEIFDWAALGLPEICNGSCLFLLITATTTTSGTVRGSCKIAHG